MILQVTCNAVTFIRYITSYFFQRTRNDNELFLKNVTVLILALFLPL